MAEKFPYDRNNVYNFVIYDIETNTSGKTAEICQLSAVDKSGLHSFNDYILPLKDVDIHATRVSEQSGASGPCSKTINQSKLCRLESHWKIF